MIQLIDIFFKIAIDKKFFYHLFFLQYCLLKNDSYKNIKIFEGE
jgi:hypothetical protein